MTEEQKPTAPQIKMLDKITMLPIKEVKPDPNNAKKHTSKQIEQIAYSIKDTGFNSAIIVDETYKVLAGHGRLLAAKKLKMTEVPCMVVEGLTEAQKLKFAILDNTTNQETGYDAELLSYQLQQIKEMDVTSYADLDALNLSVLEEYKVVDLSSSFAEDADKDYSDQIVTGRVDEMAHNVYYKSPNNRQIPELRSDMLYDPAIDGDIVNDIILKPADYEEGEMKLWLWKSTPIDARTKDSCLIFFRDDEMLTPLFNKPKESLATLRKIAPRIVSAPNFSLWANDPYPLQLYGWYMTMWCARHWQEAGFKIIPCINYSTPVSYDFCFLGIPKKAPVVLAQCRNVKTDTEKANLINGLIEAHKQIEFGEVLIYGAEQKNMAWLKSNIPSHIKWRSLITWDYKRNTGGWG